MADSATATPFTSTVTMPNYGPTDVGFERGEGAYLFDTTGKRYLDFASGIAVTSLGHAHPVLLKALTEQGGRVWHVSNLFTIPEQQRYAENLVAATFADRAFFCNSGAEAMEAALKLARRFHAQCDDAERYRVVAVEGAFHGRTLGTLAAAGSAKYLEGYGPPLEGFDHVAFGNLNELRAAVSQRTAAIAVEPVQGEGGIRAMDADYLRALRQTADEFGALLLFDEVQTGFGRTGKLFAHEWSGIAPDIMAVAKGMAGGFPCGACLATEAAAHGFTPGSHGTTFGGNPLAMAVADAALGVINAPGFLANVQAMAEQLRRHLTEIALRYPDVVAEVRGMGLLLGIRIADGHTNADVARALRHNGLLTVPAAENVVRLLPPLIIESHHVEEGAAVLDKTLAALAGAG